MMINDYMWSCYLKGSLEDSGWCWRCNWRNCWRNLGFPLRAAQQASGGGRGESSCPLNFSILFSPFPPYFRWMRLTSSTFVPRWENWRNNLFSLFLRILLWVTVLWGFSEQWYTLGTSSLSAGQRVQSTSLQLHLSLNLSGMFFQQTKPPKGILKCLWSDIFTIRWFILGHFQLSLFEVHSRDIFNSL